MINETPPPHDVVGTRSDREGISFVAFLVLALHSTLGNFLWYYTSKRRSILARAKERLETILQFQRSWQGHIIIFQLSQKIFETQDAIRSHCKVSHYESTGVTYEISSLVFSSSFFRWESIIVYWFDCSWWCFLFFVFLSCENMKSNRWGHYVTDFHARGHAGCHQGSHVPTSWIAWDQSDTQQYLSSQSETRDEDSERSWWSSQVPRMET